MWRRFDKPWEFFATALRHYYGFMSSIDEQIGRLLAYLRGNGLYDETTIIFAADHGDSHGCHAGLENKAVHMYEEIMKIPYLIKPAGHTGGGQALQPRLPVRPPCDGAGSSRREPRDRRA